MNAPEPAVLIMARAPRPGQVNTRLQPLLGPGGCARLQTALIRNTVVLARQVAPSGTYLAIDSPEPETEPAPAGVRVIGQHGKDLGARMSHAVQQVLREHHGPVLVIGTDAPTLSTAHLHDAVTSLTAGSDAVFGPALDGGYYLVAVRRSVPEIFAIEPTLWGGPNVLSASLAAARTAGLHTALLRPRGDLDTPADARAFLEQGELPADIADLLQTMAGAL